MRLYECKSGCGCPACREDSEAVTKSLKMRADLAKAKREDEGEHMREMMRRYPTDWYKR